MVLCANTWCFKMERISEQIEELLGLLRSGTKFRNIKRIPKFKRYIDNGTICYNTVPFPTIVFQPLFDSRTYVKSLLNEVRGIEYFRKATDLYCFEQSKDFHDILDLGPCTKVFMKTMYEKLQPLVESIYGFTCSRISITASRYKQKDYLLCHDDKCSDRHVAFIFYLCPEWEESDGGLLCLYSHDKSTKEPTRIIRKVIPQMNQFLTFQVGIATHHEVSEVTAVNKERYTINGWFHTSAGLEEELTQQLFNPVDPLLALDNSNEAIEFAELLSPQYSKNPIMKEICEEYRKQNSVLLPNFLEQNFFNQCINELTDTKLEWKYFGPPNQRKYEVATFDIDDPWQRLPENLARLVWCLTAPNFLDYVEYLTSEKLTGQEVNVNGRAFTLQLQRWSSGCYSLLSDNNIQTGLNMLDLNLFLKVDDTAVLSGEQGSVAYSSDQTHVIGQPTCNSLFIVNNEENTGRYVKYINASPEKTFYIYIIYMTCMCKKNTISTLPSTSEEEKLLSSDSVLTGTPEDIVSNKEFDCGKRKTKQKTQKTKKKQKVATKEDIVPRNIHCENREMMNTNNNRNNFIVTENETKQVSKENETINNHSSSGKIRSNGNTFIVTEIADIPEKIITQ